MESKRLYLFILDYLLTQAKETADYCIYDQSSDYLNIVELLLKIGKEDSEIAWSNEALSSIADLLFSYDRYLNKESKTYIKNVDNFIDEFEKSVKELRAKLNEIRWR
jgi:hypothetical protein